MSVLTPPRNRAPCCCSEADSSGLAVFSVAGFLGPRGRSASAYTALVQLLAKTRDAQYGRHALSFGNQFLANHQPPMIRHPCLQRDTRTFRLFANAWVEA